MNRDIILRALTGHELFKDLAADVLAELVTLGQVVTLAPGQILFRKGDPGDYLFCVLTGEIQIGVETRQGKTHLMNLLQPGTVFGEIALLDDLPRSADARAMVETSVFTIARPDFHRLLLTEPRLHQPVIRLLCERVRWTSAMVEAKSHIEMELRKLTSAVEHSPNIVMITDTMGRIEYVNRKFTTITGWSASEVIGKSPEMFRSAHTPPDIFEDLRRSTQAGKEWRGEFQSRRKDGSLYWETCSVSPVRDPVGTITHFVALKEDVTEHKRLQDELKRLATLDSLTGMANRRHFLECAQAEIARTLRTGQSLSVMMLDVDHFKALNDSHGHAAGDAALKALAEACRATLRETDIMGRLGGEEFGFILPGDGLDEAAEAAERLRGAISQLSIPVETGTIAITASLGLALLAADEATIDGALRRADHALYQAKQSGRNRVARAEE